MRWAPALTLQPASTLLGCAAALLLITVLPSGHASLAAEPARVSLLYNGSVHGELSDCGCKSKPLGGLARRAALIQSIRATHPGVVLLDPGNLLPYNQADAAARAEAIAGATSRMGYDVLGVGPWDLARGIEALLSLAEQNDLRFTSANLEIAGEQPFEPFVVIEQSGVKLGIVSVFDPALVTSTFTKDLPGLAATDPLTALRKLLPVLRTQSDLVVLYAQMKKNATQELLGRLGMNAGIDVAVEGYANVHYPTLRRRGSTLIVAANSRGKYLGQLDLQLDRGPDGERRIADAVMTLHELTLDLPEDRSMARWVAKFQEKQKALAHSR